MRDSENQKSFYPSNTRGRTGPVEEVPYDGRTFFESFYKANIEGQPKDYMTAYGLTEPEAAFHYNCVENSIIRAILRRTPPPPNAMTRAWRAAMQQSQIRLLDIGTGTGHWIDFMRSTFFAQQCYAVEITDQMCQFLRQKYAEDKVSVLQHDVSSPDFGPDLLDGPVDYITAIGILFHIVDDAAWIQTVENLSKCLKPKGLLLVGEGAEYQTKNQEFIKSEKFSSWVEAKRAEGNPDEVRVTKRTRSIPMWNRAATAAGLQLIDLVRSDREACITTPENDLLVFEKMEATVSSDA